MLANKQNEDANNKDIAAAKRVFAYEIQGIQALDKWLSDDFSRAIDMIFSCKGRIVVCGMGKSGHIARKIAATMASTGTPAQFVHPGEASHGDMGMIVKNDVVILLSNSGETRELQDMIYYTRRFSIPLIAIVRRKKSALVDAADIALVLPEIPEACSVEAPTTSTTMMLALGDAIAIALLERRGFGKEDFGLLHPGGKLGASLLRVDKLMHTKGAMPIVKTDDLMSNVLVEMTGKSLGCVGVIDNEGKFVGVITDGDLRRHSIDGALIRKKAADVMTKNPKVIKDGILVAEALKTMEQYSITNLFIVKENRPVGIIHIHDILRAGLM